jgi:Ca-activated chloride channel family protein
LIGLTILLIALARPQTVVSLPRIEGIVMLTFDVSGSMAADDLKPTRMEAAKEAARAFVQSQPPSVQIGVVSFSDSGFTVQVPTNEQEAVLATIARLKPGANVAGNGIRLAGSHRQCAGG